MLGHRGIGSASICGLPGAAHFERTPGKLIVSDKEVGTWLTMNVVGTQAQRSTAQATIVDKSKSLHLQTGEHVRVTWNDRLLFAGTIDNTEETKTDRNDSGDVIFAKINCVDYKQLFDRFYVSAAYENKTLLQILIDILTLQTPLWEEGVTLPEGQIPAFTYEKIVFNYTTVSACFKDLAETAGLGWDLTFELVLRFFDRSSFVAPSTIGDGARKDISSMIYAKSRDRFRNRQFFRGGFALVPEPQPNDNQATVGLVEYFRGAFVQDDDSDKEKRQRTFQLKFEVGEMLEIKRDGVVKRVGVRGLDKDGDLDVPAFAQWFYAKGEKEISQNEKEDEDLNPALTEEEILAVRYRGRFPMMIVEQDAAAIAARQAIEGGSGVYESLEENQDVDGQALGRERAVRYLRMYGRIPAELTVDMTVPDFELGHLLTISEADLGISAVQFLVDRFSINFRDRSIPFTRYTMLDGERLEGWAEFFKRWAAAGRRTVIRENEVTIRTSRLTDTLDISDTIDETGTLGDYLDDPYTWALFGFSEVPSSGELVPSWIMGRSIIGVPRGS